MTFKKCLQCIFLILGAGIYLLKLWVSGMDWLEMGMVGILCLFLSLFLFCFRRPLVNAVHHMCLHMDDHHSLMYLAGLALTLLYCVLLEGDSSLSTFLVFAACLLQGINQYSHKGFAQGAVACLFLGLVLQLLSILVSASLSAIAAIVFINLSSFVLLPNRYADKEAAKHNKTYVLLAHLILSALMFYHPYTLEHLSTELLHIIVRDSLGWGILPHTSYPLPAFVLVSVLMCNFIFFGTYLINKRPSAVFALALLSHLLLSPGSIVAAVLFWAVVCYLPMAKRYVSIEDITNMDDVPEALERRVLDDFSRRVKKCNDLMPLQRYIFRHPTLSGWHLYLHLSRRYASPEVYEHVVSVAKIFLDMDEDDILFPPPRFVPPEN